MVNEEIKARERIALAKIKTDKEIQLRKLKLQNTSNKTRISQLKNFQIGQQLNAEQGFLSELFGGGQRAMLPDEETLPPVTMYGSLMPNAMNGNEEGVAESFGFGSNKFRSGLF